MNAYQQGIIARRSGKAIEANPYNKMSVQWFDWNDGWNDGGEG